MFEYDPFSAEAMADPHRFYPELRDQHPIYRLEAYHGWAISRFSDCWQVFQDHDHFSVVEGPLFVREWLRKPYVAESLKRAEPHRSFATWDAPQHSRIRRTMIPRFSPKAIEAMEHELKRLARELLADLVPRGGFDVVGDYVGPLGLAGICRVLGLELDGLPALFKQIQRSTEREPGIPGFSQSANAIQAEIHQRVCEAVASQRERPHHEGENVVSALLHFQFEDAPLTDADIATQLTTLMLGGAETIPKLIAGGLLELALQPEQWRALLRNFELVPAAFEEIMRHQGVLQHVGRTALHDTEVGGQTIRRGERVFLLVQSANRDEREFRDAERFDIHREPRRHLALGIGRHHCIGSHLARLEGRVLLETLLEFVPEYSVIETELLRPASEFQVGYTRLPIEFALRP